MQAGDQLFHAPRFELKHRRGLGRFEQFEGRRILQRNAVDIQRRLAVAPTAGVDHFHRPVDDGQRAQAQEIELDQAHVFHIVLVELRDQSRTVGIAVQGRKIRECRGRDHHAAGVLAHIAGNALKLHGHIPDFPGVAVLVQKLPQPLIALQGLVQRHPHFEGNQLGQPIPQCIRLALHAGHVAHHRLGRQGAEGNDLRDRLAPVAAGHVVDDLIAALHAEVDVEVRHRHPLGIQKALEQQLVLKRIEIGNGQGIGD